MTELPINLYSVPHDVAIWEFEDAQVQAVTLAYDQKNQNVYAFYAKVSTPGYFYYQVYDYDNDTWGGEQSVALGASWQPTTMYSDADENGNVWVAPVAGGSAGGLWLIDDGVVTEMGTSLGVSETIYLNDMYVEPYADSSHNPGRVHLLSYHIPDLYYTRIYWDTSTSAWTKLTEEAISSFYNGSGMSIIGYPFLDEDYDHPNDVWVMVSIGTGIATNYLYYAKRTGGGSTTLVWITVSPGVGYWDYTHSYDETGTWQTGTGGLPTNLRYLEIDPLMPYTYGYFYKTTTPIAYYYTNASGVLATRICSFLEKSDLTMYFTIVQSNGLVIHWSRSFLSGYWYASVGYGVFQECYWENGTGLTTTRHISSGSGWDWHQEIYTADTTSKDLVYSHVHQGKGDDIGYATGYTPVTMTGVGTGMLRTEHGLFSIYKDANTNYFYAMASDGEEPAPFVHPINFHDRTVGKIALLLHMDGADGSTTFTDEAGQTVSVTGNVQIDTDYSVFGGASALFDGTGDLLTVPASTDWDGTTGDYTIEFWVRFNSLANSPVLIGRVSAGGDQNSFIYTYSNGRIAIGRTGVNEISSAAGVVYTGEWMHIRVTRVHSTGYTYLYVNGYLRAVNTTAVWASTATQPLYIGATGSGTNSLNGWLDEVRVYRGVAVSSGGTLNSWVFNVPTEAFSYGASDDCLVFYDRNI